MNDKGNQTSNDGQFVVTVTEGNIKFVLYSLSNFWVKVKYDSPRNKIVEISSFVAGDTLHRYSNVSNKI